MKIYVKQKLDAKLNSFEVQVKVEKKWKFTFMQENNFDTYCIVYN